MDIEKLIDEYSQDYCQMLELCYGKGMMSEGGAEAIEAMFHGIPLQDKSALDIGFGLAGVMYYLADRYQMQLKGLEINPDLVTLAQQQTPEQLKAQLDFLTYHPLQKLPFDDDSFDIVFSKGVLTHLENKAPLFAEVRRILKPEGYFIINDWLSPQQGTWSAKVQTMCERENLSLYAESKDHYVTLLEQAGFKVESIADESENYADYNLQIVDHLKQPDIKGKFIEQYTEAVWGEFVDSYQLIADAMLKKELLVTLFKCKPTPLG